MPPQERAAATPLETVGRPTVKIDGVERVTGTAKYTRDVELPGMLFASVLRSPHPHARIRSIDVSAATALPGVRAVRRMRTAPYGGAQARSPEDGSTTTRSSGSPGIAAISSTTRCASWAIPWPPSRRSIVMWRRRR